MTEWQPPIFFALVSVNIWLGIIAYKLEQCLNELRRK